MRKILIVPGTLFVALLVGCAGPSPLVPTPSSPTLSPPTPSTPTTTGPTSPSTNGESGGVAVGATSGRFTVTANLATARAGHTATLLPNGNVLVAGGGSFDIDDWLLSFTSAEIVTPSGQAMTTGNLTTPREFHTATLLQNGKALITGGNVFHSYGTGLPSTASAELYDPATGQFTATANMSATRTGHTASLLPDGRVLVFGGTPSGAPSAELFDPANGTFTSTPSPLFSRTGHTATVLPSGKVLLVGGQDNSGTLATAEIYDPVTNNFTAVGGMAEKRMHHTATLLPNGKVLVTGGGVVPKLTPPIPMDNFPQETFNSPSLTAELFDPQTETFSTVGNMNTARVNHTATLLPDGTVLLLGGSHPYTNADGQTSDNTAEIYDPATESFKQAGTANTGKCWHTGTLLQNGTVVFVGGIAQDWVLNVVETFK